MNKKRLIIVLYVLIRYHEKKNVVHKYVKQTKGKLFKESQPPFNHYRPVKGGLLVHPARKEKGSAYFWPGLPNLAFCLLDCSDFCKAHY